jgi:hypothetical protein
MRRQQEIMTNGYVENVAKKKTKRLEEVFYNI